MYNLNNKICIMKYAIRNMYFLFYILKMYI